jgi:hypothetical protein
MSKTTKNSYMCKRPGKKKNPSDRLRYGISLGKFVLRLCLAADLPRRKTSAVAHFEIHKQRI